MLRPVQSFSTNAKMSFKIFVGSCNDDSWGSDKVVEDGGHYSRAQRSLDSIYKIMLQCGHKSGYWKSPQSH